MPSLAPGSNLPLHRVYRQGRSSYQDGLSDWQVAKNQLVASVCLWWLHLGLNRQFLLWKNIYWIYRVYPSNRQKQNWKIDTSLVAIGAQNLFFSLYKLGVNFLWIREILKMYISPSFSNRKKVQYYRFCIFKGVSKLDLLHSTGHKSLKNGSKSNNLGSLIKFRKFLAR